MPALALAGVARVRPVPVLAPPETQRCRSLAERPGSALGPEPGRTRRPSCLRRSEPTRSARTSAAVRAVRSFRPSMIMRATTVARTMPSSRLILRSRFISRSEVGRSGPAATPEGRAGTASRPHVAGRGDGRPWTSAPPARSRSRLCRDRLVGLELTARPPF